MAISKRLRFEILRRDNHTCRYCGAKAEDSPLTIDHVTAVALGGTDDPANLITACKDCNAGKTSTTTDAAFVEQVAEDAADWETAKAKVTDKLRRDMFHGYEDEIIDFEDRWLNWRQEDGTFVPRDETWKQSIRIWLLRGLPYEAIADLIPVAMKRPGVELKDRWRFFCGCVWRRITEMETAVADEYAAMQAAQRRDYDEFVAPDDY